MNATLRSAMLVALALSYVSPAGAARTWDGQIVGTDAVCDSYTPTVDAGIFTLTCVPGGSPPPGAPQGCAATVNSSTTLNLPSSGGAANLAAGCSSPSTGLTFAWSKNGAFGSSSAASWTDTLAANASQTADQVVRYQVRICTGSNCTTVPVPTPLAVTVAHASGGAGPASCPGFAETVNIDFNWNAPGRIAPVPMGVSTAIVARFTTGNVDSPNNNLPRVSAAEWGSPPSARYAVLSATACDFGTPPYQGGIAAGNSINLPFAVGNGNNFGYYMKLNKNQVYFVNIKNLTAGESCSAQGSCDVFVELSKPGGM